MRQAAAVYIKSHESEQNFKFLPKIETAKR
jgi:hypothetical protein